MAFVIATLRVCKPSTPVSVFALRHENTLFFCSIGGKSGAEEGQQKLGKISTSNHESRRSYIVITGGCRTKQFELLPVKRTVKNQKIFATSNSNVTGCFCREQTLLHRVCNAGSPETIRISPRRKAASRRISTPAGAGKDFPCHYVC